MLIAILATCLGVVLTTMFGAGAWLFRSLVDVKIDLATVVTDVASVKAEHANNGGASTRDAIDRIELTVDALDGKVDAQGERLTRREAQLDLLLPAVMQASTQVVVQQQPPPP